MVFREQLKQFIYEKYSTKVGDEDSLLDAGLMDSMDLLDVMSFIEAQTGVRIPDDEVLPDNFETVNRITTLVERLQS